MCVCVGGGGGGGVSSFRGKLLPGYNHAFLLDVKKDFARKLFVSHAHSL